MGWKEAEPDGTSARQQHHITSVGDACASPPSPLRECGCPLARVWEPHDTCWVAAAAAAAGAAPAAVDSMLCSSAGAGGDEAGIWAGDLLRMYQRYASNQGWKASMISCVEADAGGYKEVVLEVRAVSASV